MASTKRCRPPIEVPDGKRLIWRPYRLDPRTGKLIWACQYGLRAWPILIDDE